MTTTDDDHDELDVTDSQVIRPFADWLREQRRGRSHDELSDSLHDLVAAVKATGKGGTLTYAIKITPLKKTGGDVLEVMDAVKVVLPVPDRDTALFYTDDDGNLTKSDPNQPAFETLRELPTPAVKVVTDKRKDKQA